MNGWRVIFEHRFPDFRFSNFRATSGALDQSSVLPSISHSPPNDLQTLYYAHFDAHLPRPNWAAIIYDQPITDVIGIVFTCIARLPQNSLVSSGSIFCAGEPLYSMWALSVDNSHFNITFKAEQTTASYINLAPHTWYEVRWQWKANGQSELFINGNLAAYRNDVHPGRAMVIDRCWIGSGSANDPPVPSDFYTGDIRYINLQIVRPNDTLAAISSLLPYDPRDLAQLKDCQQTILARQKIISDVLADFMHAFILSETKESWHRSATSGHAMPYSRKAIAVHGLSMEVGKLTLKYVRDADQESLPPLLNVTRELLTILAKWNPEKFCETFDNMQEILEKIPLSEKCQTVAAKLRKKYENIEPFNRSMKLSADIHDIMVRIRAEAKK